MATKVIAPHILDVLRRGTLSEGVYTLPGQLDRGTYQEVDKVLKGLGGKWNRSRGGHVFALGDPTDQLARILESGKRVDVVKDLQFFPTPLNVACRVCDLADLRPGMRVPEPSAGLGALAQAATDVVGDEALVDCIEVHPPFVAELRKAGFSCEEGDFLKMRPRRDYDAVVMNPPFAQNQDIDHVLHAYGFLKPGGRLGAVMSAHWTFAQGKKELAFRKWLQEHGGTYAELMPGAFAESGTGVRAVTVTVPK